MITTTNPLTSTTATVAIVSKASAWWARALLMLMPLAFSAPAQAATIYNFTFTSGTIDVAAGSFTTEGAAVDPGYELLTSLTFDYVTGTQSGTILGPFTTTTFDSGAAYNPATSEFINHSNGGTYGDLSKLSFFYNGVLLHVSPLSFSRRGVLSGEIYVDANHKQGPVQGDLTLTPAVTAVPEPTSLVLLGTGLLGVAARRRRLRA